MALRAQITGAITEPVLRWTPKQQPVLDFRINATASVRNKSTGQWEDVGSPIWVSVAFWEQEAQTLNEVLSKGDRITVEGTLVQETYQRRDGGEGNSLSLRFPKMLGVIPSRRWADSQGSASPSATSGGASYSPPTDDPWGAPTSESSAAPF
ncbi:single-stranded DNA-binding protein [Actinomycetaceae bacterium MB13-C1-2]|nr:single-stranded DNA-binding protein [Actinomycetaceae bacterium MB13-C1-2]